MNKEYFEPVEKGIKGATEITKAVGAPALGLLELGLILAARGTRFEVPMRRTIYFFNRVGFN